MPRGTKYVLECFIVQVTWRRKWQPTSLFLPGKSHGQRSLPGYSPSGGEESDPTEYSHIFPAIETMGEYLNREELDYQSILECYASSFKTEYIV